MPAHGSVIPRCRRADFNFIEDKSIARGASPAAAYLDGGGERPARGTLSGAHVAISSSFPVFDAHIVVQHDPFEWRRRAACGVRVCSGARVPLSVDVLRRRVEPPNAMSLPRRTQARRRGPGRFGGGRYAQPGSDLDRGRRLYLRRRRRCPRDAPWLPRCQDRADPSANSRQTLAPNRRRGSPPGSTRSPPWSPAASPR